VCILVEISYWWVGLRSVEKTTSSRAVRRFEAWVSPRGEIRSRLELEGRFFTAASGQAVIKLGIHLKRVQALAGLL